MSSWLSSMFMGRTDDVEDSSTQNDDSQVMDDSLDDIVPQQKNAEITIQDEESNISQAEPQPVTPSAQATLVDLLVKAFPDSMIEAPKIVIVGSQSSGKTKLIMSMIFLSLIQHPHFTDEMGNMLLQVFRTGTGLTTRRPIQVSLLHSSDQESCSIHFKHKKEKFDFGDALLPDFIERLNNYSGNEIFESPLEITIRAYQLPNIQFTDMPGLRSTDIALADSPQKTLKGLVMDCIANGSNTVVAVESALQFSSGGTDTSLLHPIMEVIAQQDQDLKQRSILVLTKCDKITPESFASDIFPFFQPSHPQAASIYDIYQCVIAAINKVDLTNQPEAHNIPFDQFRSIFEQTKQLERLKFQERGNLSCNRQCTTNALYFKINDIFKSLLSQALLSGHENMRIIEAKLRQQMQQQLAPPVHLYSDHEPTPENPFSKDNLLEEIRKAGMDCAKRSVATVSLLDENDEEMTGNEGLYLQMEIGLEWPTTFVLGNIDDGLKRYAFYQRIVARMEIFLDLLLLKIDQVFTDKDGAFSSNNASFHHLHRFENLQELLQRELVGLCDRHKSRFLSKLQEFMNMVWVQEEPRGQLTLNRLVQIMKQGRHLLMLECISFLQHYLDKELPINWSDPHILDEASTYVSRRQSLNLQYERVLIQYQSLGDCLSVLRLHENTDEQLEQLILATQKRLEELAEPSLSWEPHFWRDVYAEYKERQKLSQRSSSVPSSQQSVSQHHHNQFASSQNHSSSQYSQSMNDRTTSHPIAKVPLSSNSNSARAAVAVAAPSVSHSSSSGASYVTQPNMLTANNVLSAATANTGAHITLPTATTVVKEEHGIEEEAALPTLSHMHTDSSSDTDADASPSKKPSSHYDQDDADSFSGLHLRNKYTGGNEKNNRGTKRRIRDGDNSRNQTDSDTEDEWQSKKVKKEPPASPFANTSRPATFVSAVASSTTAMKANSSHNQTDKSGWLGTGLATWFASPSKAVPHTAGAGRGESGRKAADAMSDSSSSDEAVKEEDDEEEDDYDQHQRNLPVANRVNHNNAEQQTFRTPQSGSGHRGSNSQSVPSSSSQQNNVHSIHGSIYERLSQRVNPPSSVNSRGSATREDPIELL